jgi:hypothetical protein
MDLSIGTGGDGRFDEGGTHTSDSLAYFVDALGNDPPHEFRASRAIGRDSCMLERPGERRRVIVRAAMIKRAKAQISVGWDIEHPNQLPGACLPAPIFRKLGSDWNLTCR